MGRFSARPSGEEARGEKNRFFLLFQYPEKMTVSSLRLGEMYGRMRPFLAFPRQLYIIFFYL